MSPSSERAVRYRRRFRTVELPPSELARTPQVARSARFPRFVGARGDPAAAFDSLAVVIAGCGSVGRRAAERVARLHPKALFVVDPGRYKPESLLTSPVFPRDVRQPKAESTARACKALSPRTRVVSFEGRIEDLSPADIAGATHWVLATDNLPAEVAAAELSLRLGQPLVQASVAGELLVAQVRVLTNSDGQGPCLACGFGPAEWEAFHRETTFACGGPVPHAGSTRDASAAPDEPRSPDTAPTLSTAFLCSLAADLALVQLTRLLLELGKPAGDTALTYCGYTHETRIAPLRRDPDCPREHASWMRRAAPAPLPSSTLGQLAASAGFKADALPPDLAFGVGDRGFFEFARCSRCCGTLRRVKRFAARGSSLGSCPTCSGALRAEPFYELRYAPAKSVPLDKPIAKLGAASTDHVVVLGTDRAFLFLEETAR